MGRMLQALRQIESRAPSSPQWRAAKYPAGDDATPSVGDVMDSAQQMWEQVEAALAADKASPPDLPAAPGVATTTTATTAIPTTTTADPYSALADAVLAQVSPLDAAALMFTSVGDDEGRSAVVARLAAALAPRVPGGVLAVDGDFRAAELAAHLGVQSAAGLPEVLAGTTSWNDAVRPTVMRGRSVLPGGILAAGGAAGFEPTAMAPLLAEFRKHYRLVLVEAASLRHAETAPLAAWCDGAYLVVRLGWNTRRELGEAAAALRQCQGRLRGCIVVN